MTRRLLPGLLLAAVTACGTPRETTTAAIQPDAVRGAAQGPEGSAFWRVPRDVPAGARRGDVLWVRERADAPAGARGLNVIYVSEGASGRLEYVSGEIYLPVTDTGGRQRPIVVWNHGTAGTQDSCAPSRNTLVAGDRPAARLTDDTTSRVPALMALLARGYVVAMSDYQGLGTPTATEYLNGPTQGMAALDVARAVRHLPDTATGDQVAMYGFSQGGQTSLWAAHLAPTYAPELKLRGVVAIAPAARHLALSFYDLGIPANSGYFISRMAGLAVEHPETRLTDVLTPSGLAMLDAQTWDCFSIFGAAAGMTEPYAYAKALEPGTAWRKRLEENDAFLPITPSIPIFVLQGDTDVDVGVQLTRDVVRDLCAAGNVVEYQEHPGVDHMGMNVKAAPLMADWFARVFGGQPPRNTCAARQTS